MVSGSHGAVGDRCYRVVFLGFNPGPLPGLTSAKGMPTTPPVFSRASLPLSAIVLSFAGIGALSAAPFDQATITKTENKVSYGEAKKGQSVTRPAVVADIIRPSNFLLTDVDSRAELRYEDGSIVRVGQNAVFTFDAASRTLSLEKGTLLFHIPKGSGGGTIKTPSLTAAITGTSGKVSENMIAIIEGSVRLRPSGRIVSEGQFARINADGSITIAPFDPTKVLEGRLTDFNGLLPGFGKYQTVEPLTPPQFAGLNDLEVFERTQNLPGSIRHFFPERHDEPKKKEKDDATPTPTPTPRPVVATPVRRPISPTFAQQEGRRRL